MKCPRLSTILIILSLLLFWVKNVFGTGPPMEGLQRRSDPQYSDPLPAATFIIIKNIFIQGSTIRLKLYFSM